MTVCPESFFKTLKREEVYLHDYRTFEDAEANLSRFIEDVYKRRASRSWTLRAGATSSQPPASRARMR